jgi:hypothetical protein
LKNEIIDKAVDLKNKSSVFIKKRIRKKALENIKEKLQFAQKNETDFTKDEMRSMIEKEEKKIITNYKTKGALTTVLAMFGIVNI